MGAEQSTGAAPPPPQWRDESLALGAADGTSLQQQVRPTALFAAGFPR
jgi:hypothetical protein